MNLFFSLFLVCATMLSSLEADTVAVFEQMSAEEKKATGIDKLSIEEKRALEAWFLNLKSSRRTIIAETEIKAVDQKARRFILVDGSAYEVTKRYKNKIANWKVGDKIHIFQSKKPIWFHFEKPDSKEYIGVKRLTTPTAP